MRFLRILPFAVGLLTLARPLEAAELASEADRIVRFFHEQYQFNGAVLVSKNGEVAFQAAYGLADREWNIPNTTDTRFRLGSITKQFTAALILQLVEAGKVELQTPLSRYVPEYPGKVSDRVTIHQLLTHTSGIKSYTSMPNFRREVSRDPYEPLDFLDVFAGEPLDFEPGEQFRYNNSGYFLLGVIVEKVTGKPYEDALEEHIFRPLGMKSSGFDRAEVLIEKRATGYDARLDGYRNSPYLDMSLPYAAGSLYSTVEDLYRWDRALAEGKVLSDELQQLMFQQHVKIAKKPDAPSYGYGWFLREIDRPGSKGRKTLLVEHGGGINGFNTLIRRIPADGHLIVALNNSPGANLGRMADALQSLLYGEAGSRLKKSSAVDVYDVYRENGVLSAAARMKEIEKSKEHDRSPAEARRLLRAVAAQNPADAYALLEKADLPDNPQSAGLWMMVGDALDGAELRDEAAKAFAKAVEIAPRLADAVRKRLEQGAENELISNPDLR